MNSIILTGANRGLGHSLHKLLIQGDIPGQHIFISRKTISDRCNNYRYLQLDLGHVDNEKLSFNIPPECRNVILISNAGTINPIGKSAEITIQEMEYSLHVNCFGPLYISQHLVKKTKEIGARLFILNISSGAADHPIKGWMAYCVSKAASKMALDVLASENDHVNVTHFDPGVIDTDMQAHIRQQSLDTMPDVTLFQEFKKNNKLRKPQEVAEQIANILKDFLK